MSGDFRELVAYREACALADDLWVAAGSWPRRAFELRDQLTRAADSVGANIAEAAGRGSRADELRFLYYARGSANETQHFVAAAQARGLLGEGAEVRASTVARVLNGLIQRRRRLAP